MKILHILNHSYPYSDGYAIRSFNIVNTQRRHGMNPLVLTTPKHEPDYDENPEKFENTLYFRIPPKTGFIPSNIRLIWRIFQSVKRIYAFEKFDLIHAHSPSLCGLGAILFSIRTGIPVVYEVRAFWEDAAVDAGKYSHNSIKYMLTRFLETLILWRADAVTTIAGYMASDIMKRRGKKGKIFLVPNGVDCMRFSSRSADKFLKQRFAIGNEPVIGFIGSFYRFEGIDVLLKALARIKNLKFKALLVGGGEMESEWKKLQKELGLSEKVIFTGRIPYNEVQRYYSVMNICVYPRHREPITERVTPLKPLEAMALGKLTIGSDVGGIKEIITGGGLLFSAGDDKDLARLLSDVIIDSEKYSREAKRGKQIAEERFSWDTHIERYERIYRCVLRNRKAMKAR